MNPLNNMLSYYLVLLLDVVANSYPAPKQEDIFENIVFRTPLSDVTHNKKTVYVEEGRGIVLKTQEAYTQAGVNLKQLKPSHY